MIGIYALSNADCENDIYIGSSKNIKKRMIHHKESCNNVKSKSYNNKVYSFIREHGNWEKWRYHIIEEFDVYDKKKLEEREDYWQVELQSSLNIRRARRTKKKHYQDNKDDILKKQLKYKEENKEVFHKRAKQNHIKYRKNNKDVIKKRNIKYKEENKAKLTAPNWCECGGVYQFREKSAHYKSKRCLKYMASIISPSAPPSL